MELRNRLLTLPQELYDEIYELTFALDTTDTVIVNQSYKPPFQLQINRASREKYGKKYFGSAAGFRFNFKAWGWETYSWRGWRMLRKWLSALTFNEQMVLQRIEVYTGTSEYEGSDLRMRNVAAEHLDNIGEMLGYHKIWISMRIFHVDSRDRKSGNAVWVSRKNLWS